MIVLSLSHASPADFVTINAIIGSAITYEPVSVRPSGQHRCMARGFVRTVVGSNPISRGEDSESHIVRSW